jgi:hypothetical protein
LPYGSKQQRCAANRQVILSGVDQRRLRAELSTYLGHVSPAGTYWYLTAVPELMELAAGRLQLPAGVR